MAFSPSGRWLVTAADGAVHIWRAADLGLVATLSGDSTADRMLGVTTAEDGTEIAAVQLYGGVFLYCLPR